MIGGLPVTDTRTRTVKPVASILMLLSLFAASVVSSLIPLVNAEALVVGAVLAAPPAFTLIIAMVVTAGQVAGKVVLFRGGAGLTASKMVGESERAKSMARRLEARPGALRATLFASAAVGLPPLYLMAVVAGAARLPIWSFTALCLTGRFMRFYAIALVPALL